MLFLSLLDGECWVYFAIIERYRFIPKPIESIGWFLRVINSFLSGWYMNVQQLVALLRAHTVGYAPPLINTVIDEFGHDPYLILIACLLSLRAKDSTTVHICRILFQRIKTPEQMLACNRTILEHLIFKTGFYKNKAHVLQQVSAWLLEHYAGRVPATYDELIAIPGVGPKTANLVLGQAFGIPSICVDVHVHRISNRLGLIKTNTVEETEQELKKVLPQDLWIPYNTLLVMWGQNICVPISPKCSICVLKNGCKKVSVIKSR